MIAEPPEWKVSSLCALGSCCSALRPHQVLETVQYLPFPRLFSQAKSLQRFSLTESSGVCQHPSTGELAVAMKMNRHNGFTLIEGMVTLSVVAVLLSTGVPSFSAMIKNNRLTAENDALRAVLATARFEAKAQRATVTVCRSTNAIDCSAGDWADGYIAFIDLDEDGHLDSGELLLERRARENQGVAVSYSLATDSLQFDSSGYAAAGNGTFTFCDNRGATEARALVVSAVGVMRAARVSEKVGSTQIVQDHVGKDVTCNVG